MKDTVSVITPVYNGEKWLSEALDSILMQRLNNAHIELSIFDDGSTDGTAAIIKSYESKFKKADIMLVHNSNREKPLGVGYAKNRAIQYATGEYLCFMDADDIMLPNRIQKQYDAAVKFPNSIIGTRFSRLPEDSTPRLTKWCNSLSSDQLFTQIYTSHGPTLAMITWFCSKQVFDKVGGFDERGKGIPEDLIFFFKHLDFDGGLYLVQEELMLYRYHPEATTFSINESTIWDLRIERLEKKVLSTYTRFSIWNAGKQGRRFFRSLNSANQNKVVCFCDVDPKKLSLGHYTYEESRKRPKPKIPIVHFKNVQPPVIICMKQDLTAGEFERNLNSLNFEEGKDYIWFS